MNSPICLLCKCPMQIRTNSATKGVFDLYSCLECQAPNHKTAYRRLYHTGLNDIIADNITLDEWVITRYFAANPGDHNNCTVIWKKIEMTDISISMEPTSSQKHVYELDHIVVLPWDNIDQIKKKLSSLVIFS